MAELISQSGQFVDVGIPSPKLKGEFIPAVDNPSFAGGLGIIIPWGGGANARESMLKMGELKAAALGMTPWEIQQSINFANYSFPLGDVFQDIHLGDTIGDIVIGPPGAPGLPGAGGRPGEDGTDGADGEDGEAGPVHLWKLTCWAVVKSIPASGAIITADIYDMSNTLLSSGTNVTCILISELSNMRELFPKLAVDDTILVKYINGTWYAVPLFESKYRIFEVQSSATGYGMYTCRMEKILSANIANEAGALKTGQYSADSYTVMNLKESDPHDSNYDEALALYDLMLGWAYTDDGGTLRWVGIPLMNDIRWVVVKEVTPAAQNITCNMWRRDETEATSGLGSAIEVYGELPSGINLDDVVPQLKNGLSYPAHCIQGKWWFLQVFDIGETAVTTGAATLRIAKIKALNASYYECRLLAKDKSTELGSANINVYPVEELGSNDLDGTDVWPDLAVNDFISVYYDIDGVWRTPIVVDDTTTC